MSATFETHGRTFEDAIVKAASVFTDFFGAEDWTISDWQAEPSHIVYSQGATVEEWAVTFTASLTDEAA